MPSVYKYINSRIRYKKTLILTIRFAGQEKASYEVFLLEKKKGRIQIINQWENIESKDQLPSKLLHSGTPIILHVRGEGVITRESNLAGDEGVLSKVFPGFQEENYYFQIDPLESGQRVYSVVRKNRIYSVLNDLGIINSSICGLYIGTSPFLSLISYMDNAGDKVILGEYTIEVNKNHITAIHKNEIPGEEPVKLFETEYSFPEAIAMSCGVLFQSQKQRFTYNDTVFINGVRESFSAFLYRFLLKGVFTVLFIMLLINFFLFDYLYNQKSILENEMVFNRSMLNDLSVLKEEFDSKKEFVDNNQLGNFYYLSYFSDQIGQMAGSGILFEELSFNPLANPIKSNQQILFRNGIITAKGQAESVESYQRFLSNLKGREWNRELISQDYQYTPGNETANFEFEIMCDFNLISQ